MLKRYFLLLCLISASALNAQIIDQNIMNLMDEVDRNKILRGENMITKYAGSPYLSAEFKKGTIELIDGKIFKDIPLRYNIFNDNFEVANKGEAFGLEKNKRFLEFNMDDRIFRYESYQMSAKKTLSGYLERLTEGEFTLYCKYNVSFSEAKKAAAYKEAVPATFKRLGPDYLLQYRSGNIYRINSLKDILKVFPEAETLVKEYSPKGKIRLRKKEDFVKLVEFLNK